jgi:NTP pyrophosphatase (non-canonical NTP hydrolase)
MLGHIEEAHKLLDRITGVKQEPDVGLVLRLEQFDTTYQARPPEGVLKRVQRELVPWVKHNFGDRPGWMPVMGIQEECGELAHAFLKRAQGIRGTDEQHLADIRDALADIIIFACDAATAHGIDLEQALSDTWAMVKQRDFIKDVADGGGHRHD